MKKIIFILTLSIIFLYGCQADQQTTEIPVEQKTTEPESTPETPEPKFKLQEVVGTKCDSADDKAECQQIEIISFASEQAQPGACDLIEADAVQGICFDSAIISKATQESDLELCKKLTQEKSIQNCEDNVYFNMALTQNKKELCDNIKNTGTQDMCKLS